MNDQPVLLVMAGGTGGHIFPALAVLRELEARGWQGHWLGTALGLEAKLIPEQQLPLHLLPIKGLRGKGWLRRLAFPFTLLWAIGCAWRLIRRLKPAVALGMGGYASGPGALAAKLAGVPLVVHEQNALAGMTNKRLAGWADALLQAFPSAFPAARAETVGNPVRADLLALPSPAQRFAGRSGPLRVLVLGGSQGAVAINQTLVDWLAGLTEQARAGFAIRHQVGARNLDSALGAYRKAGLSPDGETLRVDAFIADMAEAYQWADLVIGRAGALTVAELAAVGVGSILVPFPAAVDDHQTHNAGYLAQQKAALLCPQPQFSPAFLNDCFSQRPERAHWLGMAEKAWGLGWRDAHRVIADRIQQLVTTRRGEA